MDKKIYGFLALILAILIFYLSITPVIKVEGEAINTGILRHMLAYLLLSFLIFKATDNFKISIFSAGTYGFLIEIIQYTLPYRAFQISDILLNYLSACLILVLKFRKFKRSF